MPPLHLSAIRFLFTFAFIGIRSKSPSASSSLALASPIRPRFDTSLLVSQLKHLPIRSATTMKDDARAYNDYVSAAVDVGQAHITSNGLLTFVRSTRDIDSNRRRRYMYSAVLPKQESDVDSYSSSQKPTVLPPAEVNDNVRLRIPSPSGDKVAIFRDQLDSLGNSKKNRILEIWADQGTFLRQRISLPDSLHGNVLSDDPGFGTPCWSNDEEVLVYPAERPLPKTLSFFDDEDIPSGSDLEEYVAPSKIRGGKYTVGLGKTENWGEKYSKQGALIDLFCVNTSTGKVGRIDNVPGGDLRNSSEGGYALGQPVFSPDDKTVVYVGWDAGGGGEMPRRLGLIYCQQRPTKLYASSVVNLLSHLKAEEIEAEAVDDSDYNILTPTHRLSRSPRFSPRSKDGSSTLVFLCNKDGFDTHSGCFALHAVPWAETGLVVGEERVIVRNVDDPRDSDPKIGTVAGMKFPGLYMHFLSRNCFYSSDGMALTTNWGSCQKIVKVSLRDASVELLLTDINESSEECLCASPTGSLVISQTCPNKPATLYLYNRSFSNVKRFLTVLLPIVASRFSHVDLPGKLLFDFKVRVLEKPPVVPGVSFDMAIQSVLLLPNKEQHPNPPLLVVPHGGPHSVSSTNYMPSYAFLCGHGGYAVLLVNYRGSTGFGQKSIASLPTNIGSLDVEDVIAATLDVKNSGLVDPDRIGICGGSHGGFLTGHCTGQYPDMFRAAAMRNPVVNLASMVTATDIPDWCYVEALGSYNWKTYNPSRAEELQSIFEKSPVKYIDAVKTPTLMALGLRDLRVPPSQGLEWHHTLRSKGVATKLLTYDDDGHDIGNVVSEADHWINVLRWFNEHMQK